MTESSSETPVGEIPAGGGPRRKWPNDAARVADYRRRRKEAEARAAAAGGEGSAGEVEPVAPERAQTALAATLEQLREIAAGQRETWNQIADRIEAAVAGLTDPDAVAATLDACAANAREEVAVAEARAADAERARRQAEHETDQARAVANDATEVAGALDARLGEVEADLEQVRGWLDDERTARRVDAEEHATLVEDLRSTHADQIIQIGERHQEAIAALRAELDTERRGAAAAAETAAAEIEHRSGRLATETAARAQAEETVTALRGDLERARQETTAVRSEVPGLVEAARVELRAALGGLHAAEVAAAEARGAGEIAHLNGQLEGCRAHLEALTETNAGLRAELAGHQKENG